MTVETNSFGPPWTIVKLLDWSRSFFTDRGFPTARLDAELLLSKAIDLERVQLYAQFDRPLDADELDRYRGLVKRRANGEPVAYLIGSKGFWTFEVTVDSRVLIPRPETETLVETCIKVSPQARRVLDLGTGSGIIAIALALELPEADVVASDVSPDALAVAKTNFDALTPDVSAIQSDLFSEISGSFDLIASNPPYVGDSDPDLEPFVKAHEPHVALFAKESGLGFYQEMIPAAYERLNDGGWLVVEIGHTQGSAVSGLFNDSKFKDIEVTKDLSGSDRVVRGRR